MLTKDQFFQFRKLFKDTFREVECPCGIHFYTNNPRAIYHSNACRQYFFRNKQLEIPKEEEQKQEVRTIQLHEQNDITLKQLREKEKIYNNKLKAI